MGTVKRSEHKKILKDARAFHDARFEIDHPRPTAETVEHTPTALDRVTGSLWVVWLVLAIAGAAISAPHTLATLRAVLPGATGAGLLVFSIFGFLGVELGLIALAFVSASEEAGGERRMWSVKGLANAVDLRMGRPPRHDLSHLPARRSGGGWLVASLFAAALIFNQADALRDVMPGWRDELVLLSRVVVGALGPVLLLVSGHRFASEVVRASQRADRARLDRAEGRWQREREESWERTGETWIEQAERSDDAPPRATSKPEPSRVSDGAFRFVEHWHVEPNASDRERARHFGVTHTTIGRWRREAEGAGLLNGRR